MMTEKEMAPDCLQATGADELASCDALDMDYTLMKDVEEALPPICEVGDVANFMSMKPSAVRELCRSGALRAIKAGALWRIPRAWLLEFVIGGGANDR